jgi:hypothetical protein
VGNVAGYGPIGDGKQPDRCPSHTHGQAGEDSKHEGSPTPPGLSSTVNTFNDQYSGLQLLGALSALSLVLRVAVVSSDSGWDVE